MPTLRNIAKTAPYMHSGRFDTLSETVEFYSKGRGHAAPKDKQLQIHWHIWEPNLTEEEVALIVAFLQTLTDESLTPVVPEQVPSGLPPIDQQTQIRNSNNINNKDVAYTTKRIQHGE